MVATQSEQAARRSSNSGVVTGSGDDADRHREPPGAADRAAGLTRRLPRLDSVP